MKILRMLRTLITVRGLEVLLLGKEVALSEGVQLGIVVDIKKELSQDRIWMVIDNLGQEAVIPIERISSIATKVIFIDNFLSTELAANKG
ncbi:MAG: hypothetical protein CO103_08645 [Chloroflexi bacterium CG_4_9_14_3_um_filter_45_9]|nr:MAG: hypothetical protein AUK00_03165 [Dehalococcoidia bacterium CG2_30_46_9]PIX27413.1 MAG: hypothetical protein COZ67_02445 [Chloroflexi bacterium CG_4_8_14_3_um_filter_45_15]PJB47338.1 MAG: hypothetical protein CO103_08645 [Chloroflexi bacterium CG_4_9_14_3_um_filter_45_9]